MNAQTSPLPTAPPHDPLETLLVQRFLEEAALRTRPAVSDLVPAVWSEPPLVGNEAKSDPDFLRAVRANLQAASRHIQLGHRVQSFRDCSHPACRDAANLIPSLEMEKGATEEELDAIFERALARCFS
jgi:hypothetical protein